MISMNVAKRHFLRATEALYADAINALTTNGYKVEVTFTGRSFGLEAVNREHGVIVKSILDFTTAGSNVCYCLYKHNVTHVSDDIDNIIHVGKILVDPLAKLKEMFPTYTIDKDTKGMTFRHSNRIMYASEASMDTVNVKLPLSASDTLCWDIKVDSASPLPPLLDPSTSSRSSVIKFDMQSNKGVMLECILELTLGTLTIHNPRGNLNIRLILSENDTREYANQLHALVSNDE